MPNLIFAPFLAVSLLPPKIQIQFPKFPVIRVPSLSKDHPLAIAK